MIFHPLVLKGACEGDFEGEGYFERSGSFQEKGIMFRSIFAPVSLDLLLLLHAAQPHPSPPPPPPKDTLRGLLKSTKVGSWLSWVNSSP